MAVPLKELASIVSKKAELLQEEAKLWQRLSNLLNEQDNLVPQKPFSDSQESRKTDKTSLQKKFLTSREASEYLGVAEATLAVWRCVGKGPSYAKVGRCVRYTITCLEEFVKTKKTDHDLDVSVSRGR